MKTDKFDPWAERYSAADITAATGGIASKRVLQNWHARGQWVTAVEPTLRGKSYSYSFAHMLEAVLVVELAVYGVTNELARSAISSRLAAERLSPSKAKPRSFGIEDLADFRNPKHYWAVSPRGGGEGEPHNSVVTILIEPSELASTLHDWPSVLLLNIPAIVKKATNSARTSAGLRRANLQLRHLRKL